MEENYENRLEKTPSFGGCVTMLMVIFIVILSFAAVLGLAVKLFKLISQ